MRNKKIDGELKFQYHSSNYNTSLVKERDRRQGPKYAVASPQLIVVFLLMHIVPLPGKYLHLFADRFSHTHSDMALFPTLPCLLPFTPLKK